MTFSAPLQGGLTEQWPNVGCTQERLLNPAAASALRLQPGASQPQKKFEKKYSSSISGFMENHNTHLTPGFTLNDLFQHQRMWLFSGVCWDQVASTVSTKCPSNSGTAFSRVAQEPPGPHSTPGDFPFPAEHLQVSSCRVADSTLPLFIVLMQFKPSPFSFLLSPFSFLLSPFSFLLSPFLVQLLWLFPIFHFLSSCFSGGVLFCILPPDSVLSLHAKTLPCFP